jgi:hypothetical protein
MGRSLDREQRLQLGQFLVRPRTVLAFLFQPYARFPAFGNAYLGPVHLQALRQLVPPGRRDYCASPASCRRLSSRKRSVLVARGRAFRSRISLAVQVDCSKAARRSAFVVMARLTTLYSGVADSNATPQLKVPRDLSGPPAQSSFQNAIFYAGLLARGFRHHQQIPFPGKPFL